MMIPLLKKQILPNLEKLPRKKVMTKPQNQKIKREYRQRPYLLEMGRLLLRESSLLMKQKLEQTMRLPLNQQLCLNLPLLLLKKICLATLINSRNNTKRKWQSLRRRKNWIGPAWIKDYRKSWGLGEAGGGRCRHKKPRQLQFQEEKAIMSLHHPQIWDCKQYSLNPCKITALQPICLTNRIKFLWCPVL